MNDNETKALLDRESVIQKVDQQFRDHIALISELVDYGVNLLIRAYESSPRDPRANYLLHVHLHQFLVHLDAVGSLLENGNCLSAHLQLRTMLENVMLLEWILFKPIESDNKINHIWVANWRSKKHWESIGIPGKKEAIKNQDAANLLALSPEKITFNTNLVAAIDSVLSQPLYVNINSAFEKEYVKRGHDPYWYQLCGASSIKKIAEQLGVTMKKHEDSYTFFYGPCSGVTHGADIWRSMPDSIHVVAIRHLEDLPMLFRSAVHFAMSTYNRILEEYAPGELKQFAEKWRGRFVGKW